MNRGRRRLIVGFGGLLVAVGLGAVADARSSTVPHGAAIYRTSTRTASWLEVASLDGSGERPLTRRPDPGEIRADGSPSWSSGGTAIAFARETPTRRGLFVVNADGRGLREVVDLLQLPLRPKARLQLVGGVSWSSDSQKLLFAVRASRYSCLNDALYRVDSDGSNLRALWRRPTGENEWATGYGWSPDGTRALVGISHNDGDCYGDHILREELFEVADTSSPHFKSLLKTTVLGDAAWSPDGSTIAATVSCGDGETCNVELIGSNGGSRRLLTHFKERTEPYGGFDNLPFVWDGDMLLLGRFRSILAVDPRSGAIMTAATAPCPVRRCVFDYVGFEAVSPQAGVVFDVTRDSCGVVCEGASTEIVRRYVLMPDRRLVSLGGTVPDAAFIG
jgi:WD40 repeat protein